MAKTFNKILKLYNLPFSYLCNSENLILKSSDCILDYISDKCKFNKNKNQKVMKRVFIYSLILIIGSTWMACNNSDKENSGNDVDQESEEAIKQMAEEEIGKQQGISKSDSILIEAYKEDKTTITLDDLDEKAGIFDSMAKVLYKNTENVKLAAVIGFRSKGNGEIIIQKEGGKPIKLAQTKANGMDAVYGNGNTTVETQGNKLILKIDGKTENFEKIQ